MATIAREDIDALNVALTVTVAKEDYLADFQKELKRYRKQASLKGFRKGNIPMSVVRKMFGRSILAEVVNKELQEEMSKFLYDEEAEIDFLGQPIPSKDQEEFEFSVSNLDDYVFKFDLGLAPQFELQGLGNEETLEKLVVEPAADKLDEELLNLRRRFGVSEEVEDAVAERDIITLKAVELDGEKPKEGGIDKEFTLFIENITDDAKEAFLGKKIGDSAVLDVFNLEANTTVDHVRKYLLGLAEDDDREVSEAFSLTIDKISRHTLAALDEDFYKQAFGEGDVSNEKEALAKIQEDYRGHFEGQTNALLFRNVQELLMEKNPLEFPETFLKRWLVTSNEKNTEENVEAGFDGFLKGLQWTLLREKLIKQLELDVTAEEVKESFAKQVMGYFGGQRPEWLNEEMISGMVDRMMNEEKSVREKFDELMNDKLSIRLQEEFTLTDKVITPEELQEIVAKIQAENEAQNLLLEEEE
ncbi:MAG: trigger factor [Lewinella sp.]|jgi:trigger factor|uniref:trigger factor n=1 Tax=Lewinella sp. TaxID=2004506 RepID=UPI003D6A6C6A